MVKVSFLALLLAGGILAQSPTITCSPSCVAQEGQTITLTSTSGVTWSQPPGSVGSLVTVNTTHATYTAPASVVPMDSIYGVPLGPDDSAWHVPISNLPVHPSSAAWMGNITGGTNIAVMEGYSKADGSTPTGTIKEYYGSNVVSNSFVLPATPYLKRENGAFRSWQDTNDHHQIAVRRTDSTFWEIYNLLIPTAGDPASMPSGCQDSSPGCNAISAIAYSGVGYGIVGGTDAAALPLAPLTLKPTDVYNGLNHAVRFSTGLYIINNGISLWPAIGYDYNGNASGIPYGAKLRLRLCNGGSITSNCVTLSSYSALAQNLLNGLATYGAILADAQSGNSITLSASAECWLDPNVQAALGAISGIPPADFDIVDESSLEYAAGSVQVCPHSTSCVSGTNTYVTPTHQAIVVATPGSGSAVSTSIALQGVAIGLDYPTLYAVAGSYSYAIPSWVNGTANQSVTWSKVSGVGSVTSAGVYTPPASTSGGTAAVLKVTSAADANAVAYEHVSILPTGASPSGTLRIDVGGGGLTDGNGNAWQPDQAFEVTSSYALLGGDYPGWTNNGAASNPLIGVYQSAGYTYGGDLSYRFLEPNGNYKVHLLLGTPYDGAPFWQTTYNPANHTRMDLEAQGQIAAHNFNLATAEPAGYNQVYGVPTDAYIPAKVTNNVLQVALRGVFLYSDPALYGYCMNCMSPLLNGLEILPDSTPAHWAIDTQQTTHVAPGGTLQLYLVDWYTGLTDAVWSVVSGAATISSSGLLTVAATQPGADGALVVKVQSASNPAISATAVLYVSGSQTVGPK